MGVSISFQRQKLELGVMPGCLKIPSRHSRCCNPKLVPVPSAGSLELAGSPEQLPAAAEAGAAVPWLRAGFWLIRGLKLSVPFQNTSMSARFATP